MRFKHLLLAMTMLAMPVITYAGSETVWEKEAQDPATIGIQLVGSRYGTVKEAYNDTLGDGKRYGGVRTAAGTAVGGITSQIDHTRRIQKEREEAIEDTEKKVAEARAKLNQLREELDEKEKEWMRKVELNARLGKRYSDCLNAGVLDTIAHTSNWSCDGERKAAEQANRDVTTAYQSYAAKQQEVKAQEKDVKVKEDYLNELQAGQEEFDEQLARSREGIDQLASGLSDETKQRILEDVGPMNTDNWDSKMGDRYERAALQQKLDQMELMYGTDHMDLSTPEGQEKARTVIDALNKPSQQTSTTTTTP